MRKYRKEYDTVKRWKQTISLHRRGLFYTVAASVMPTVPIWFLFNQNIKAINGFLPTVFLASVLALASLLSSLVLAKLMGGTHKALPVLAVCWIGFWGLDSVHSLFAVLAEARNAVWRLRHTFPIVAVMILGVVLLFRFLNISRVVSDAVALMACMLFLMNFVPALYHGVTRFGLSSPSAAKAAEEYGIKTSFAVDSGLPHPNIYWIHMDAMVGFDAVEEYFGQPQTELKKALTERGFVINESARLEAGFTGIAIPALTSPTFYDNVLAEILYEIETIPSVHKSATYKAVSERGASINKVYQSLELLSALENAGYLTINYDTEEMFLLDSSAIIINDQGSMPTQKARDIIRIRQDLSVFTSVGVMKELGALLNRRLQMALADDHSLIEIPSSQELIDELSARTGVTNPDFVSMAEAMGYITMTQEPRFVYFMNYAAHVMNYVFERKVGNVWYDKPPGYIFALDENGNYYDRPLDDPNDVQLYYAQHQYAAKTMLALVDIIETQDPDAVVILQADHGIHGIGRSKYYDKEYMEEQGYSLEDMLNLNFSVMSAVRVPEKYGSLEEALEPLDIARWLVNSFVGQNYAYIGE
jgi:hypothetical protein